MAMDFHLLYFINADNNTLLIVRTEGTALYASCSKYKEDGADIRWIGFARSSSDGLLSDHQGNSIFSCVLVFTAYDNVSEEPVSAYMMSWKTIHFSESMV